MQKIMIIEDDPLIREELSLLLENEGYGVVSVTDFTDIPEQIRDCAPDLLLLDLGLPPVGRNFHNVHAVYIAEFFFLCQRSTRHTRLLLEFIKEVLERNRR